MPHVAHESAASNLRLALDEGTDENPIFNSMKRDVLHKDVNFSIVNNQDIPAPPEILIPKQRVPEEDECPKES